MAPSPDETDTFIVARRLRRVLRQINCRASSLQARAPSGSSWLAGLCVLVCLRRFPQFLSGFPDMETRSSDSTLGPACMTPLPAPPILRACRHVMQASFEPPPECDNAEPQKKERAVNPNTEALAARNEQECIAAPCQALPMGAHLVTERKGYEHHGIYVGGGQVIHCAGSSRRQRRGPVERISITSFACGLEVYIKLDFCPRVRRRGSRPPSRFASGCKRLPVVDQQLRAFLLVASVRRTP